MEILSLGEKIKRRRKEYNELLEKQDKIDTAIKEKRQVQKPVA